MAALVTIDEIKDRTRIDGTASNVDLARIADEATDIVIGYIKQPDNDWTTATVPPRIKTAILLVSAALYDGTEPLSVAVRAILHRDRDPALA